MHLSCFIWLPSFSLLLFAQFLSSALFYLHHSNQLSSQIKVATQSFKSNISHFSIIEYLHLIPHSAMDPEQKQQIPHLTQNQSISRNGKNQKNEEKQKGDQRIRFNEGYRFFQEDLHSRKKKSGSLQSPVEEQPSIEEPFLDQHIEAFKSSMERLQSLQEGSSNVFCYQISVPNGPRMTEKQEEEFHLSISENKLMKSDQRGQFQVDLSKEIKLKKFLKLITEKAPGYLADQLVYIANICWKYFSAAKSTLSQPPIQGLVNSETRKERSLSKTSMASILDQYTKLHQKLFADQKLNCLTLRKMDAQEVARDIFLEFIKNYSQTIFYIVNEQFTNPLAKKERQDEEQSDQCSLDLNWSEVERDAEDNARNLEGISPRKQRKIE